MKPLSERTPLRVKLIAATLALVAVALAAFGAGSVWVLNDYLIERHDRLLVGSDFPAMEREDPCGRTLRSLDLPEDVLQDITWNNAYRWLGIDPPK